MTDVEIMPALRPVTAARAKLPDGQDVIVLQDTTGVSRRQLVLSPDILGFLELFDGSSPVTEVKAKLVRAGLDFTQLKLVDELIDILDQALVVEGPHFKTVRSNFHRCSYRYPVHAGSAYPENTAMCHRMVSEWMRESRMELADKLIMPPKNGHLAGVIAPHYNLVGSGRTVATAHRAMWADFSAHGEPDVVVILGTAHFPIENHVAVTGKTYMTPLGETPGDPELAEAFASRLPFDPYAAEIMFRGEFVCEFQALFLSWFRRMHPESKLKIFPLLVSPLEEMDKEGPGKIDLEEGKSRVILDALRGAIEHLGRNAVFIASADMSHVGKRFDPEEELSPEFLLKIEQKDLDSLDRLKENNPPGFVESVMADGNKYRVCSTAVMYMVAELAREKFLKSEILQYTQMEEEDTGSMVSFCAQAFYEKAGGEKE